MRTSFVAGVIAFAAAVACAHGRSTPYDNDVLLADAMLHHHLAIAWPGPAIDAVRVGQDHIVIEGPLPALLVLPLVAIFGPQGWTQTLLACVLCGVATGAAWELARRYGTPEEARIYLVAFLVAGTDLLWCAQLGDVWHVAHVCAVAFTLLALVELEGRRRGWLVALYAACAFEARFPLVLALAPYALALRSSDPRTRARRFLGAAAVLAAVAIAHAMYDVARFGTPLDIGFRLFYEQDIYTQGPMFGISNLPMQLYWIFVKPPLFRPTPPFVIPDIFGVALTWVSPALILAVLPFRSRPLDRRVAILALAAILTAIPSLLYYDPGGVQFGYRHMLDVVPFLFGLMALGARAGIPRWGRALVVYSIVVGVWGISYWNNVYRPQF